MAKKMGRPSKFTQELADRICNELSEGNSLRKVCLADDMPDKTTVFSWMRLYPDFLNQYARAKEESADALFEETQDIADESLIGVLGVDSKYSGAVAQSYRLRVDTRKWMMSKQKPKKYGDKLDLSNNGKDFPTPILGSVLKSE